MALRQYLKMLCICKVQRLVIAHHFLGRESTGHDSTTRSGRANHGAGAGTWWCFASQDASLALPASRCLASVGVAAFRVFSYSAATCKSNVDSLRA